MPTRTIARLFDEYADAAHAVRELEYFGVPRDDISLVANNAGDRIKADSSETEAVPGAEIGAGVGAVAGGGAGLLAGLGLLAIPGVGPVVAAGWLVALAVGAAGGAAAGGLLGGLVGAGISSEHAHVFVEGVRRGGTVVAVRAPQSELPRIVPIMNRLAVNLLERGELYRKSGWQSFDPNAVPYTADQVRSERALHAH